MPNDLSFIPLIHVPTTCSSTTALSTSHSDDTTARAVVNALKTSGFLLVVSPLLTVELQSKALKAASDFLENGDFPGIISHPTDPKVYSMLDSPEKCQDVSPILKEYFELMQNLKMTILRLIAKGLDLEDEYFFAKLHDENNDTLRLINYLPVTEDTGNRCKEHSDYGTITLLSTDGISGLEAFHEGAWYPVPHVEGSLVVNIGSLLSGWTRKTLHATLHRVAGPTSLNSKSLRDVIIRASRSKRTSLAFFADPNKNVTLKLQGEEENSLKAALNGMSITEYIQFRSGGSGDNRSGVSFTEDEKNRIDGESAKDSS